MLARLQPHYGNLLQKYDQLSLNICQMPNIWSPKASSIPWVLGGSQRIAWHCSRSSLLSQEAREQNGKSTQACQNLLLLYNKYHTFKEKFETFKNVVMCSDF